MAGSLSAQSQDQLLPAKKRITDEALARDWALIQKWLARADSLPRDPGDIYARARAIALLEFVGTEYDRANRSPVLDTSFVHAVAIVERIEAGRPGTRRSVSRRRRRVARASGSGSTRCRGRMCASAPSPRSRRRR